ncbi:MAG: hypothetical protein ACYTCN_02440 [Planctomycetota bacterium]|jgi:hypothetical protein
MSDKKETLVVPSWIKVLLGTVGAGLILYTLPVYDLLMGFMYFFVLPVVLLSCAALAVVGAQEVAYTSFENSWNKGVDGLRDRIVEKAATMRQAK